MRFGGMFPAYRELRVFPQAKVDIRPFSAISSVRAYISFRYSD
jgi:hypothetical protein